MRTVVVGTLCCGAGVLTGVVGVIHYIRREFGKVLGGWWYR